MPTTMTATAHLSHRLPSKRLTSLIIAVQSIAQVRHALGYGHHAHNHLRYLRHRDAPAHRDHNRGPGRQRIRRDRVQYPARAVHRGPRGHAGEAVEAGGLVVRLASRWFGLAAKARRLGRPDAVVVGYLGHFDVHLARLLYRRGRVPLVLDHLISAANTAKDRRLDGGMKTKVLRLIDAAALRAADIVVVDTEEHLEIVPEKYRSKAVVVPVGAPSPWHAAAPELPVGTAPSATASSTMGSAPLKVVFYGLYTPLQGTPVIGEALGRIAGAPVEVTMIGRGQDEAETKRAAAANQ